MGGVVDTLFGSPSKQKSKSESSSGNYAWDPIKSAFSPALGYVTQGGNAMWDMLKGGPKGFADSGGFDFLMKQGTDSVNSNFYSRGLGESGAAMKGLDKYRYGLASTYLNQYMDQLGKYSGIGLGAGGVMADAGKWGKSKSSGEGKGGKDGIAGDIIGAIAMSDPAIKENIVPAGVTEEGVPLYYFDYKQDTELKLPKGRFQGVMADELEKIKPGTTKRLATGYLAVTDPKYFPRKAD